MHGSETCCPPYSSKASDLLTDSCSTLDSVDNDAVPHTICYSLQGLDKIAKGTTKVTTLTTRTSKAGQIPASPIPYPNDLDVAPYGTIYFSDSSHFGPVLQPKLGFFDTMGACVLTLAQVCSVGP